MKFKVFAALVAGALSLWLAGGASAQNAVCPTMPLGDNSNACASTAYADRAAGSPTLPNGQIFVGNASNLAVAQALSGDCSITNAGVITCTKTNGTSFAPSATTDTTNAGNISSGTLSNSRLSAVPNSSLASMAAGTAKCRVAGNGTGAPQDCSQPVINVTDAPYSADPTGTNDATTAIQNAINALPATGGTVLFPVGSYLISSSLTIGNGSGSTYSTRNNINLECVARVRPALNGVSGSPSVGACNINSNVNGYAVVVQGPISGWGIKGISVTITSAGSSAGCLNTNSASFGDTQNFMCNNVQNIGILEFINSGGTASYFNTWRNVQVRLGTPAAAAGLHIGSGQASTDNFGDSWDNLEIIPQTAGQQCFYIGSADSMVFNRLTVNPGTCSEILSYSETNAWPSGIAFINPDFGTGNTLSNNSTPGASARPNVILGLNNVNNGTIPNLANLTVYGPSQIVLSPGATNATNGQIAIDTNGHPGFKGSSPTLTAGCNGAGSSVNGNDNSGVVTAQSAGTPTTCTITFAKAWSNVTCVASGLSAPLTGAINLSATTLQVNFAALNSFSWTYQCSSIN